MSKHANEMNAKNTRQNIENEKKQHGKRKKVQYDVISSEKYALA